jgi:hypothetical protein
MFPLKAIAIAILNTRDKEAQLLQENQGSDASLHAGGVKCRKITDARVAPDTRNPLQSLCSMPAVKKRVTSPSGRTVDVFNALVDP